MPTSEAPCCSPAMDAVPACSASPHHDVGLLQTIFDAIPTAGFFAMGELGPVGGRNFVHGYTASVVLFQEPNAPTLLTWLHRGARPMPNPNRPTWLDEPPNSRPLRSRKRPRARAAVAVRRSTSRLPRSRPGRRVAPTSPNVGRTFWAQSPGLRPAGTHGARRGPDGGGPPAVGSLRGRAPVCPWKATCSSPRTPAGDVPGPSSSIPRWPTRSANPRA